MAVERIRGVYGGAWGKLVAGDFQPSRAALQRLGRSMVASIVSEARKDLAKQSQHRPGDPEGIPNTEAFFRSFAYRIVGDSTVEITSTWPTASAVAEGRGPYPLTWLTQAAGVPVVPMRSSTGHVIFRTTPASTSEAWIHPGFFRHNFIERGIRNARREVAVIMQDDLRRALAGKRS